MRAIEVFSRKAAATGRKDVQGKEKTPVIVPGLDKVKDEEMDLETKQALADIDATVSMEMARRYRRIKNG